jgi:hypothetical protein
VSGIPASFQLAGHTIKVAVIPAKRWRHGADCDGIWLPSTYQIQIHGRCKGTHRQQVFVHEMTHALLDVAGHDTLSRDEAFVDRIAQLLTQALTTFESRKAPPKGNS